MRHRAQLAGGDRVGLELTVRTALGDLLTRKEIQRLAEMPYPPKLSHARRPAALER